MENFSLNQSYQGKTWTSADQPLIRSIIEQIENGSLTQREASKRYRVSRYRVSQWVAQHGEQSSGKRSLSLDVRLHGPGQILSHSQPRIIIRPATCCLAKCTKLPQTEVWGYFYHCLYPPMEPISVSYIHNLTSYPKIRRSNASTVSFPYHTSSSVGLNSWAFQADVLPC